MYVGVPPGAYSNRVPWFRVYLGFRGIFPDTNPSPLIAWEIFLGPHDPYILLKIVLWDLSLRFLRGSGFVFLTES